MLLEFYSKLLLFIINKISLLLYFAIFCPLLFFYPLRIRYPLPLLFICLLFTRQYRRVRLALISCHRLEGRQLIAFREPLQPSPLFLALVFAEEILIYLFFLKDTADGNMPKASLFRESTPTELALYFLDLLGDP